MNNMLINYLQNKLLCIVILNCDLEPCDLFIEHQRCVKTSRPEVRAMHQ